MQDFDISVFIWVETFIKEKMKRLKGIMTLLFAVCIFTACSSSDEDEIFGTGLTGKWDLTEVLNGPAGMCKDGYSIFKRTR